VDVDVDDLKSAIKKTKPNDFQGIDANMIVIRLPNEPSGLDSNVVLASLIYENGFGTRETPFEVENPPGNYFWLS
jgi:hypothetical protein